MAVRDARSVRAAQRSKILDGHRSGGYARQRIAARRKGRPLIMRGNPEGISKECGKGGKPASWLSMLSTLCHFHALFLPGVLDARTAPPDPVRRTRHERLLWSAVNECIGDIAVIHARILSRNLKLLRRNWSRGFAVSQVSDRGTGGTHHFGGSRLKDRGHLPRCSRRTADDTYSHLGCGTSFLPVRG